MRWKQVLQARGLRAAGAMVVVAGSLAAATAASALPNDPIDPPTLPDDSAEPFVPPANGFTWSVPSRFGTYRNGIVDYHWNEAANSDHAGPAYTYDPAYVNPSSFPADFDGCPSQAEEDAAGNATNTYTWVLASSGTFAGATFGPQHDCHLGRPEFAGFPAQGTYHVTLTVTTPQGVATTTAQDVTIKDLLVVSLGDSYASGEGNPDVPATYHTDWLGNAYIDTPARWEDRRCHRSAYAAPAQAARALEAADPHTSVTFLSFACSGATINTNYDDAAQPYDPYAPVLSGSKPVGSGVLGPYIGAEPPTYSPYDDNALDYTDKLPSQIDQLTAALAPSGRHIDALMVSAGGNDLGFGPIAGLCVLYYDCANYQVTNKSVSGMEPLSARVEESRADLPGKYSALAQALAPFAASKVYITEYPDPTRNDQGAPCAKMLDDVVPWWMAPLFPIKSWPAGYYAPFPPYQIDGSEVAFAGGTVGPELNAEITKAAQANGWTLVDGINDQLGNLFSGHGYCATDSWIRHAHDSTYLQGPLGPMMPPPDSAKTKGTLHPTAAGLAAVSQRIVSKVAPDLVPPAPAPPPSFSSSNQAGSVTSVTGANGWLLGGCAGAPSCPAAISVDVTDAAGIRGASFSVNGVVGSCPNPAPGLTCSTTATTDSTGKVTAYHWAFRVSDGLFDLDFAVSDRNGQQGSFSRQVKVDLADPTDASAAVSGAASSNGWYRPPASVTLTGVDAGASGIHSVAYQLDGGSTTVVDAGTAVAVTGDGAHSISYWPVDWAGRTGATHTTTFSIDGTAPMVTYTAPAASAAYTLGQTVPAAYACNDAGSGVASCTGTVANGAPIDTSSVGTKQFAVTATDNVGNTTTQTVSYAVDFKFTGFNQPLSNAPTLNVLKAGAAAPVKFSLSGPQGLAILAAGSPASQPVACDSSAPLDTDTAAVAASASGLTYDATSDQYVYTWKTDKAWAGTCRQLTLTLVDGTTHRLLFKLT